MANKKLLRILFVEDIPSDAELAIRELRKDGLQFDHRRVDIRVDFVNALNDFKPDIIISDYMMPSYDGMQALLDAKDINPQIPFILFTGSINEETAVKCIQAGADDYIIKEHLTRLPYAVKEVLEKNLKEKEKKAAELLLKENEEKLQSIFRAAPVGIGLVINRIFMEVNDTFCTMTGYTLKELIGKSIEMIYATNEEFESAGIDKYGQITDKGTGSVETRFKCKSGRIIYVLLSSTPLDQNDLLKGVTFTVMDITERKRAEEKLRESEEKFRSILENSADAIFITDQQGKYVYTNKAVTDMLGFSSEEMKSKTILDMAPQNKKDEYLGIFNQLQNKGKLFTEIELLKKNGSFISTDLNAILLPGGLVYGSSRDITERKLTDEALKHAKEKAEASDKLKTSFLNNISHEVRTPLNGILGFADLMSQIDISEEEKRVSLSMLYESSDRLLNTITNYMDISLINSGTMSVYKKNVLPEKILRELYANKVIICSARNLELYLEIPERSEKIVICSDPEILRKILTHLLNNAIKFTEKGSIKYGFTVHKAELEFFVKDTGIGIGKESLESVFERFVKEDRGPLRISEGSGLGLSISKGLAELLGGKLRVESKKGIGSTFFFTVPVEKEIENDILHPVERKQKENKKTWSILVAEDDLVNFYYLRTLLKHHLLAEIIHASNGKEAVDKFLQTPNIDIILMDIKMPVMDGLEATRQIKAVNQNIPVIAITASAMAGDESRILDAGCDNYLIKPINKKMLLEKMAEYNVV